MKLSEILNSDFSDFKHNFEAFMRTKTRNLWVNGGETIQVYIRKGHHNVNGTMRQTLDIATINIAEEAQGQGLGTAIIAYLHASNPFEITFVENILNKQLLARLRRQGWQEVNGSTPPCLFKPTEHGDMVERPITRSS